MAESFLEQIQRHLANGAQSELLQCLYKQWIATQPLAETPADERFLASAQATTLDIADTSVMCYRWGHGPKILTVHGWGGATCQFKSMIEGLCNRGFSVIGCDAPAHGRSPGNSTTGAHIVRTLQQLDRLYGPFHAAIGHSFGTACLTHALTNGLVCERAILISCTAQYRDLIDAFLQYCQLPRHLMPRFYQHLEMLHGTEIWQHFSTDSNAKLQHIPALIIHDLYDRITPVQLGKQVLNAWPNAQWLPTEGLGHRRILDDHGVIERIAAFLTN